MSVTRCLVCDEPTENESEICDYCQANFMHEEEEDEAEIGTVTNAKLTAGFRMLKGQGE